MNNQNVELDQLFAIAREQAPETSFEEIKKRFLGTAVLAAGGVLATKGIIHLFTKKWIIMMTIITLATSAAIVASTFTYGEHDNQKPIVSTPIPIETQEHEKTPVEEPMEITENQFVEEIQPTPNSLVGDTATEPNETNEHIEVGEPILTWSGCKNWSVAPPDSLKKEEKKIIPYTERFIVTQSTTEEELELIKQQAEDAGIVYSYKAKYIKDKLDELKISMSLNFSDGERNSNMTETREITDISKKDKIVIAWIENPEGKAMIIGDKDDWDCDVGDREDFEEYMKEFEVCMKEFEESMREFDQMNFAFVTDSGAYVFNMDCGDWENDFDIIIPTAPEIPELEMDLEIKEFEEQLEELEEINEEMIEEIEEKIEELEEKLEEMEERLEERKKEFKEKREREHEREEDE